MKDPKGIALVLSKKADEPDEDDAMASEEEVMAMKAFDAAQSPEERAAALKNFIKLCGGY